MILSLTQIISNIASRIRNKTEASSITNIEVSDTLQEIATMADSKADIDTATGYVKQIPDIIIEALDKGAIVTDNGVSKQSYVFNTAQLTAIINPIIAQYIEEAGVTGRSEATLQTISITGNATIIEGQKGVYAITGTKSDGTTIDLKNLAVLTSTGEGTIIKNEVAIPTNGTSNDNRTISLTAVYQGISSQPFSVTIADGTIVADTFTYLPVTDWKLQGAATFDQNNMTAGSGDDRLLSSYYLPAGASGILRGLGSGSLGVNDNGIYQTSGNGMDFWIKRDEGNGKIVCYSEAADADGAHYFSDNISTPANTIFRLNINDTTVKAEYSVNNGTSWVTEKTMPRPNIDLYICAFLYVGGGDYLSNIVQTGFTL